MKTPGSKIESYSSPNMLLFITCIILTIITALTGTTTRTVVTTHTIITIVAMNIFMASIGGPRQA